MSHRPVYTATVPARALQGCIVSLCSSNFVLCAHYNRLHGALAFVALLRRWLSVASDGGQELCHRFLTRPALPSAQAAWLLLCALEPESETQPSPCEDLSIVTTLFAAALQPRALPEPCCYNYPQDHIDIADVWSRLANPSSTVVCLPGSTTSALWPILRSKLISSPDVLRTMKDDPVKGSVKYWGQPAVR